MGLWLCVQLFWELWGEKGDVIWLVILIKNMFGCMYRYKDICNDSIYACMYLFSPENDQFEHLYFLSPFPHFYIFLNPQNTQIFMVNKICSLYFWVYVWEMLSIFHIFFDIVCHYLRIDLSGEQNIIYYNNMETVSLL